MTKQIYDKIGQHKLSSDISAIKKELEALKSSQLPINEYSVSPNSQISIQDALNNVSSLGGGRVLMRNGTYLLDTDIVVPDNLTLEGENGGAVILDFGGNSNQVIVSGELVNSTGTCAINNRGVTVTGTGTAWTNALIGEFILLKGRWFEITAVADTTHLTIINTFDADSISGQSVVIATTATGSTLLNFTVQNSAHSNGGVYFAYSQSSFLDGISVINCTIGINFLATSVQNVVNFFTDSCGIGAKVTNSAIFTMYNYECYNSTGTNLLCDRFYNVSNSNATLSSAGGNNITLTNCESWGFYDMENTTAGGKGIELTGCTDIEIFAQTVRDAASDGIKLTANDLRVSVHNTTLINNVGYGVNIADASSDRNTITSSFFKTNTAGTLNNVGTNTINANNQT